MLRSMYSGISGMRVNQTKLDVTGNNIANVGTVSFKGQRTRFQDMLSQNAGRALGASLNLGGVNAKQVGLGVQLAGIDTMTSQGMMQPTGRNLDMAVDGEGYFMVARGPVAFKKDEITIKNSSVDNANGRSVMFTRDGSFNVDSEGNLLSSDGYRVLGYAVNGTGADGTTRTSSLDDNGNILFVDADTVGADKKSLLQAGTDLKTLRIPETIKGKVKDATGKLVDGDVRLVSFSVDKTGLIKGVCQDGKVTVLGQIAMSSFKNPAGLEKAGGNLLRNSPNSGEPVLRTGIQPQSSEGKDIIADNSSGYGDVMQGALEMSNVDLAEQFTDMITATRAFQAAGKTISTGDEILQDIINLKR